MIICVFFEKCQNYPCEHNSLHEQNDNCNHATCERFGILTSCRPEFSIVIVMEKLA